MKFSVFLLGAGTIAVMLMGAAQVKGTLTNAPIAALAPGFHADGDHFGGRPCAAPCAELFQGYAWALMHDVRHARSCEGVQPAYRAGCMQYVDDLVMRRAARAVAQRQSEAPVTSGAEQRIGPTPTLILPVSTSGTATSP
ncbi:hypothetical protein J5T34_18705 [Cupriavidus gilardii]|uniref:hypothetical protein n=1 Tax=Cupriavidus gilardii TaxID=82541 RepID=UPI001ABE08CC|nr:hypothetical protein [Cupriavidus gilardii]MBO4122763.1 hypothetical protein [Cupriavidus gilardii]